jgi:hypothetical protein
MNSPLAAFFEFEVFDGIRKIDGQPVYACVFEGFLPCMTCFAPTTGNRQAGSSIKISCVRFSADSARLPANRRCASGL